jgi:hypothetical protein
MYNKYSRLREIHRQPASTPRVARHVPRRRLLRLAQAPRRLLRLRRVSGCLSTSRSSSSTTSPTPHVRVPRHLARLVVCLVDDYFVSRRLIVNYFDCAARLGASAHREARRRLLHLRRAFARFVVDYFAHATHPDASACHAARRRLLRPRHASGCLGTSRGTSRGSSSTTAPTPRVRVPRHLARLVARLVVDYFASCHSSSTTSPTSRVRMTPHVAQLIVDYFALRRLIVDYCAYATRPGASTPRATRQVARRRLLRLA